MLKIYIFIHDATQKFYIVVEENPEAADLILKDFCKTFKDDGIPSYDEWDIYWVIPATKGYSAYLSAWENK